MTFVERDTKKQNKQYSAPFSHYDYLPFAAALLVTAAAKQTYKHERELTQQMLMACPFSSSVLAQIFIAEIPASHVRSGVNNGVRVYGTSRDYFGLRTRHHKKTHLRDNRLISVMSHTVRLKSFMFQKIRIVFTAELNVQTYTHAVRTFPKTA